MWSFVKNKKNKQWIWIAINKENREIIGLYIGTRSAKGAKELWESIAKIYREQGYFYTDFWESYEVIFPKEKRSSVGKHTGLTNYVERLNNTFRQRCSRLVRKTLSFSKKIENHIGAVWYFALHYNEALRV